MINGSTSTLSKKKSQSMYVDQTYKKFFFIISHEPPQALCSFTTQKIYNNYCWYFLYDILVYYYP